MKILVVDDDPAILKLCATALRKDGHQIVACAGGQQALTAALMDRFDLALCDINLPDVHGLDIVRAVKMQAPDLPIIVMSALDAAEWRDKSIEAGADHFLSKPLRLDVLRNEVRMAALSRDRVTVALHDLDPMHRMRIHASLVRGGCQVTTVEDPAVLLEAPAPDLVIVDAGHPATESVVRWAGTHGVHCFVLVEKGNDADDALMRMGASLIMQKPVEPEALLIQARFLASRPRA